MNKFKKVFRGDSTIWALMFLLLGFSFLPVFSASTNLAYTAKGGSTISYIIKHMLHAGIGIFITYQVHKVKYQYYRTLSRVLLPIMWVLLIFTQLKGTIIGGANASRWIQIPFIGISFQTSTFSFLVLMLYVSRYLAKAKEDILNYKKSFIELWIPVFITIGLILPSNFSTAALIFAMVLMLVFISHYPLSHLFRTIGISLLGLVFFFLVAKAFPGNMLTSRVATWEKRITSFASDEPKKPDDVYQIEISKTAIATGGIYGVGPGKSVQRNFLPQSSSDFIFAIIVEEYGLIIGGYLVLLIYLVLFFRFLIASHKTKDLFGKYLIIGLGFPIFLQALINMGVAVSLFPVTGQPLPLISSGGSSIWATCIALGIIISVTKKEEEIKEEEKLKKTREEALEKLIQKQIEEDEKEALATDHPLKPIF